VVMLPVGLKTISRATRVKRGPPTLASLKTRRKTLTTTCSRAAGITTYLENGGTLEHAQNHSES
jgi:hypothetical protein